MARRYDTALSCDEVFAWVAADKRVKAVHESADEAQTGYEAARHSRIRALQPQPTPHPRAPRPARMQRAKVARMALFYGTLGTLGRVAPPRRHRERGRGRETTTVTANIGGIRAI